MRYGGVQSGISYLRSLRRCNCGNLLDAADSACDSCGLDHGAATVERFIVDEFGRIVTMRDLARRYRFESLPRQGVRR